MCSISHGIPYTATGIVVTRRYPALCFLPQEAVEGARDLVTSQANEAINVIAIKVKCYFLGQPASDTHSIQMYSDVSVSTATLCLAAMKQLRAGDLQDQMPHVAYVHELGALLRSTDCILPLLLFKTDVFRRMYQRDISDVFRS